MKIVSVSRRTDIPAAYSSWFLSRLKEGFTEYSHPYTKKKIRVLLTPEEVAGFVFWSKNYASFFTVIPQITNEYRFYFHFTITGYGSILEPNVPSLEQSIQTFIQLSEMTSPKQVILRYDPIFFSPELSVSTHVKRFTRIVSALENKSSTCIISILHIYKKIQRVMTEHSITTGSLQQQIDVASQLKEIGSRYGFNVYSCCCPWLGSAGLMNAECISDSYFRTIYADFPAVFKKKPTRKGCGCVECQDIGTYNTCPHGCLYCYANTPKE